ncbi:STAS domain-containing protein [Chachezhania sediminis]|uniref:STAS domain-containing protein n=1 Tax=Chachezhania sediminis TaxID=2599291 RepID=UPI00131B302F|nr:STAS domain-containing protein [Chachezhania sediminis]
MTKKTPPTTAADESEHEPSVASAEGVSDEAAGDQTGSDIDTGSESDNDSGADIETDIGSFDSGDDDGRLTLPETMDFIACEDLAARIGAARHTELEVDAGQVGFLGTLCLQVLLAAHAQWKRDDAVFSLTNPSTAFRDGLRELGIPETVFDS